MDSGVRWDRVADRASMVWAISQGVAFGALVANDFGADREWTRAIAAAGMVIALPGALVYLVASLRRDGRPEPDSDATASPVTVRRAGMALIVTVTAIVLDMVLVQLGTERALWLALPWLVLAIALIPRSITRVRNARGARSFRVDV